MEDGAPTTMTAGAALPLPSPPRARRRAARDLLNLARVRRRAARDLLNLARVPPRAARDLLNLARVRPSHQRALATGTGCGSLDGDLMMTTGAVEVERVEREALEAVGLM
jgi:hypothetical protein